METVVKSDEKRRVGAKDRGRMLFRYCEMDEALVGLPGMNKMS
jgi:hypothetical protein